MKTLRTSIVDFINSYNYLPDTVYILSGFNYFLDEIEVSFLLDHDSFLLNKDQKIDLNQKLVKELIGQISEIIQSTNETIKARGKKHHSTENPAAL